VQPLNVALGLLLAACTRQILANPPNQPQERVQTEWRHPPTSPASEPPAPPPDDPEDKKKRVYH
jgi:hypothetical protein